MSGILDNIHKHHRALQERISSSVELLTHKLDTRVLAEFIEFLKTDLIPHAVGEERSLYPAVVPLLKAWGNPTATMSIDHDFIVDHIRKIEALYQKMQSESDDELYEELKTLLIRLQALLDVHLEKEERVYLPLVREHLSEAKHQEILDLMHSVRPEEIDLDEKILDVRILPPVQRHDTVFSTFDQLEPGSAFVLVNDHDPKPLYYEFLHEREGEFEWEYLEEGPSVWRVRIRKVMRTS